MGTLHPAVSFALAVSSLALYLWSMRKHGKGWQVVSFLLSIPLAFVGWTLIEYLSYPRWEVAAGRGMAYAFMAFSPFYALIAPIVFLLRGHPPWSPLLSS